jgi:hypothetical protein
MIREHGISGFHNRWQPNYWCDDRKSQLFPIEHFIFLAKLRDARAPLEHLGWALEEEIRILAGILKDGASST